MVKQNRQAHKSHKKRTKKDISVAKQERKRIRAMKMKALVDSIAHGTSVTDACENVHMDRHTYYDWLEKDKRFRKRIAKAKVDRIQAVVDAIHKKAVGYNIIEERQVFTDTETGKKEIIPTKVKHIPPSDVLCMFLVCNKLPLEFKNIQRIEQHVVDRSDLKLTDNETKKLKKLAEAYTKGKVGIK